MIVSFLFPTQPVYAGGVAALFEFANGLARRGNEVHIVHGPAWPGRIERVEDVAWFEFEPTISHHIPDSMDDPALPAADVVFSPSVPDRLGLPAAFVQGHGMMDEAWERSTLRAPCPKFCIARWLVDLGVHYGSRPEQMLHVPMGIDHELFALRRDLDDRPVDVAVLYSTHPAKGWRSTLQALRRVRERRPGLRVAAFSVPPPEAVLPEWITFHTDPPRRELADLVYNRSKLFVQGSLYEGFGFTPVEAMACGSALVTTDNGGSRDYALHDETALVVPVGDVEAMADAVCSLLDDDGHRRRLALAGNEFVSRFCWDEGAALLEEHLARYIADPEAFRRPPGPDRSFERPFTLDPVPAPLGVQKH